MLLFLVTILICVLPTVLTTGGYGLLEARPGEKAATDGKRFSICISYNSDHQSLPTSVDKATFHQLIDMTYTDGCSSQEFINSSIPLENNTVAVMRGNCTFIRKAQMVQSANGAAALVVDYKNASYPTNPGGNHSEFQSLNITLATISYNDFMSILNISEPVYVALYAPSNPLWDPNMILMIFFSTLLVVSGASWSAYNEWQGPKGSRRRASKSHDTSEDGDEKTGKRADELEDISVCAIMIWFALICAMIVLLYFFYDYMVYIFIALFSLMGSYSLYKCLMPLWSRLMPVTYGIPVNRLPCIHSKVKLRSFLLLMPCLTIGIFWAIERHAKYAWAIQDTLGAAFCVFFIHSLRLPNLKVITVLLVLLLIYDVFFVFITPLFTSDGNSIMESVATGGRGRSKESLPMVFLLPKLTNTLINKCTDGRFSLLGFGDVIIPGLLVSYNAIFDVKTGSRMLYFIISSIGYFVGMVVCMISLVYMNSGQPALLYLVPGTLFTTIIVAFVRKDLKKLYFGQHRQQIKSDSVVASKDTHNEDGDVLNDKEEEEKNLIN